MKRFRYVLCALLTCTGALDAQFPADPWKSMDSILAKVTPPTFADKEYLVTAFGAREGGSADCSEAFRAAIDSCSAHGGGTVMVPKGTFRTGGIYLRSNVNLHLQEGAVIKFSRDPKQYLPLVLTRWEGVECMNYAPFIYAYGENNIAVTGEGTLDGQADQEHWWPWKGNKENGWREGMPNQLDGRRKLFEMGEQGLPVAQRTFGEGFYLRPNFIEPYNCKNILIEGIRIVNSPMWEIHPVLSGNVTVRGVHIDSHGPNNDGCNPESCDGVVISDCTFDTGDDCIAIKSGRNNDGRRIGVPSTNIVVRRCSFHDGHGGVTIGSEMSGGVRNVFVEDCEMESPILYSALRIKSNAVRGGVVENVYLRNIRVGLVAQAVVNVDLFYEEGRNGKFLPSIRNISVEKMSVDKCETALNLVGYDDAPLRNIRIEDCCFKRVTGGYTIKNVDGMHISNTTLNGKDLTWP